MTWKGKTAIVTGAGTGIGRAVAQQLAGLGIRVALCGRRQEPLEETAASIQEQGGTAQIYSVDVTDPTAVETMVASVAAEWGAVDLLINNAGRHGTIGPLWTQDPEDWWADMKVNMRGTMLGCRYVLPQMIQQGSGMIVNISGGGAVAPRPFGISYASSKAAVLRLTDSLAEELRQRDHGNIIVLAFNPGLTRTAMTETIVDSPEAEQWLPVFGELFASGQVHEPAYNAERLLQVVTKAEPALSGCILQISDPLETILEDQAASAEELHLRRRTSWET